MFRSITIKTRLVVSGLISTLAILIIAVVGYCGLTRADVGLELQIVATQALHFEMMADMMHEGVEADVIRAILIGPNGSPDDKEALKTKLSADIKTFRASIKGLQGLVLPDRVAVALREMMPRMDDYLTTGENTALTALSDEAGGHAALPDFMAKFDALEVQMGLLGNLITKLGEETSLGAVGIDVLLQYVLLGTAAVAMSIVICSAWAVTRSVTRPIERLRTALRAIAQGELGIRIGAITRDDDIGAIARDIDAVSARVKVAMDEQAAQKAEGEHVIKTLGEGLRNLSDGNLSLRIDQVFAPEYEPLRKNFNETVGNLSRLIAQVLEASESIQARSFEISRAAEDLSARTETQAATLEETAAALEEMTASVNMAADNAKEVEVVVTKARRDVEESGRVVQGAVTAMNEIESSSNQISQIIGVIDDIAFQTNLLALNAGVEAARAGDAGRGFAVVAAEVRALAQRSSLAAKEIKVLISASSQNVHSGVQQVDSAGRALSTVVDQVAQISRLVSTIASGSIEQAQGLNEINIGVAQLDQVTQQNAAMVEKSGAATQALNQEVVDMTALVSRFTVLTDQTRKAQGTARRPRSASGDDRYALSA